ncbi:MAG TPA: sugar ABC transporter permease [Mycobacteriales bacterium]|jgi:multiple sugar transport system permease protein|nr:sugar ABC transporter permease [Mycobacteriales bacterium]
MTTTFTEPPTAIRPKKTESPWLTLRRREAITGYAAISPWILGFLLFTVGPMAFAGYLTFTKWDLISSPQWVGFANFTQLIHDSVFRRVLLNTLMYTGLTVPFQLIVALGAALLLNLDVWGKNLYRAAMFLPSQIPFVATAILWFVIYNPDHGLANEFLGKLHIPAVQWLTDGRTVKPALIIMGIWAFGNAMIIFLAGLQNVPASLQEAASIDGAGVVSRFWHVTIPMLSPIIFFNLILGTIGALQVFVPPYVMTNGGPGNDSLMGVLYIYQEGFQNFQMGYASLLSWILFVVILVLTLAQFKLARRWVYYEGDN